MRHWVGPWGILIAVFWQNHCWDKKEGRDKATGRPHEEMEKAIRPLLSTRARTLDFPHGLRARSHSKSHRSSPNHSPVLTALTWLNEALASHPHPRFLHPAAVDFPWECPALLEGPETLRVSQPCAQTFPQATTAQPAHPAPGLEDLVARGLALSS